MTVRVGVVGLGEAGGAIAAGLQEGGVAQVIGFDAMLHLPAVAQRAADAGVRTAGSLAELAGESDVILCLTSASTAVQVATEIAPHLRPDHVYSDWNSGSPQLKKDVAEILRSSGAGFADGAVMAAVPKPRHRVPVLLSGPGSQDLYDQTAGLDMQLTVVGTEPGQASAVKMFRSLLVKGLEALLIECVLGARTYDADAMVLDSMNGSLPMDDWSELASYLTTRTFAHGKRRAEEMRHVSATLAEAGVDPLVADGCGGRLRWFAGLDLAAHNPDAQPKTYQDVFELVDAALDPAPAGAGSGAVEEDRRG